MAPPPDKSRAAEPALWVFAVAVAVVAGPARVLWASPDRGWLSPFIVWACVLALGAWAVHRGTHPP